MPAAVGTANVVPAPTDLGGQRTDFILTVKFVIQGTIRKIVSDSDPTLCIFETRVDALVNITQSRYARGGSCLTAAEFCIRIW